MDRSDKIGLSAAGAGHVLLLAMLSVSLLPRPAVPPVKQDTIDVSLVDDIALTSSTRSPATPSTAQAPETGPVEDAAPAPSPEPEPVAKPAPAPPPPPAPKVQPKPEPKPEPKAEPKPEPKPVPKPVPKPAPKPVKDAPAKKPEPKAAPAKPKPKPKPAAPAKPTPAKSAPAKKTAAAKPSAKPSATPSKSTATSKSTAASKPAASSSAKPTAKPAAASGSGKADKPRASRLGPNFLKGVADDSPAPPTAKPAAAAPLGEAEKRALNTEISRQLKPKWKAPTGGDVDQLVTVLRWRLNEDGSLASGPELVEQTGKTETNRPQQQLHVEAAIRAVRAAAPFDLPPQYYSTWKNIVAFRFDKRL